MKTLILSLAVPFILSACSAGSDTANKVSYSNPTSSQYTNPTESHNSGFISPSASCYSDEVLSLGNYPAEFRRVTCDSH